MKVLHIDTEKNWRGGQNQLWLLVSGLKKLGIENHCFFQPGASFLQRFENLAEINLITMRNEIDVKAARKIAKYCDKNKIEVIHTHTARAHTLGLWVKYFRKSLKLIVHKRVEPKESLSFFDRLKYRSIHVDHYIVISRFIQTRFLALGIPEKKISLIPSGIEIKPFTSVEKRNAKIKLLEERQLPSDSFVIGSASHLSKLKGQEFFLEALAKLKDFPRWQAFIAGDGELKSALEQMAQKLGISDRLHFLGFVSNMRDFYLACDTYVLPSLWEGLGSSLLDAANAGCSLIASNVGGISDIVQDQSTGYLVNPADADSLSVAIEEFFSSPAQVKELSENAFAHVKLHFDIDTVVKKTLEIYRRTQ